MSIRLKYETYGVDEYYKNHHKSYSNPHMIQIKDLLIKNKVIIKNNKILDLCCGTGEVTRTLLDLGYKNIKGCDPYTNEIYKTKTNQECYKYNFVDLINYKLEEEFDCVICSFGMHLCSEKNMTPLINALKYIKVKHVIIITPHKRPNLDRFFNNKFVDFVLTDRGKKVYLMSYN
jgi:SAM-dependent methyltransferase